MVESEVEEEEQWLSGQGLGSRCRSRLLPEEAD